MNSIEDCQPGKVFVILGTPKSRLVFALGR